MAVWLGCKQWASQRCFRCANHRELCADWTLKVKYQFVFAEVICVEIWWHKAASYWYLRGLFSFPFRAPGAGLKWDVGPVFWPCVPFVLHSLCLFQLVFSVVILWAFTEQTQLKGSALFDILDLMLRCFTLFNLLGKHCAGRECQPDWTLITFVCRDHHPALKSNVAAWVG